MNKLPKILICPFFGELPPWFDKFQPPQGYTLLLDQDIEKFKERVRNKLGIEYPGVWGSPKLWDYRGSLGVLYEEELKNYDYYGHCDLDVVFGDVNHFLPDDELAKWDVWSSHNTYVCGCFSMYRNVPKVNGLFSMCPTWQIKMTDPVPNGWIETDYSMTLEISGLKYAYTWHQGWPWDKEPRLEKKDGKLYQFIKDEYIIGAATHPYWKEILLFHFRHSKQNGWPL